ncbi:MAG: hypothetical protein MZV70_59355 [Desulfobacterales bacterium]|nr:hypothetical protein [Desulfobacterales bacterium]
MQPVERRRDPDRFDDDGRQRQLRVREPAAGSLLRDGDEPSRLRQHDTRYGGRERDGRRHVDGELRRPVGRSGDGVRNGDAFSMTSTAMAFRMRGSRDCPA